MIGLIFAVILSGISLSVDAFAVSVCDGMVYRNMKKRTAVLIPLTFGFFQAAMPIIGFYVGLAFLSFIDGFDHWIAFGLLVAIGGKMVVDGIKELREKEAKTEMCEGKKFFYPTILLQGVATSIDALAVGFSINALISGFATNVVLLAWICVCIIGLITFCISLAGLVIGVKVGQVVRKQASVAQIIGGIVLVLIAIKIVL